VGLRAVLDAVVKREIPTSLRESNPRTSVVQPVASRYTWTELYLAASTAGVRKERDQMDCNENNIRTRALG
jgi:hypothetical protein